MDLFAIATNGAFALDRLRGSTARASALASPQTGAKGLLRGRQSKGLAKLILDVESSKSAQGNDECFSELSPLTTPIV